MSMEEMQDFLKNEIQPFCFTDSVQKVLEVANKHKVSHVPITDNDFYTGCLLVEDAETAPKNSLISDFKYTLDKFYVLNTANWFEVFQVLTKNQTNLVPVLNEQNKYIGYYELQDCIKQLSDSPFFIEQGNTLLIEKEIHAFSFSEVTQIIEGNNGKLLGLFISKFTESTVQITIKFNTTNMNSLLQSFRRYEYNILSDRLDDDYMKGLKKHSDYLDKYLNI